MRVLARHYLWPNFTTRFQAQQSFIAVGFHAVSKQRCIGLTGKELQSVACAARSLPPRGHVTGSQRVAVMTGGSDKPYALGLATALVAKDVQVDLIGSDELDCPEIRALGKLRFFNLRGDQRENVSLLAKFVRIFRYYFRLLAYVLWFRPAVIHILWNNKFEHFDRTVLMLYYRLMARRVVLTVHNVNTRKRDGCDSALNRLTLRTQYRLCHRLYAHTERMRDELVRDYGVPAGHVNVIPFGINNTIPARGIDQETARTELGLEDGVPTLLVFGQIAPYKGIEFLVAATELLVARGMRLQVIIAGKIKRGHEDYWTAVQARISRAGIENFFVERIGFIPDEEVEPFFMSADAIVLPYREIFQSGLPFLAYSFGLPVIAADVGSLREEILVAKTGFLFEPGNSHDLARIIEEYFRSPLYQGLSMNRDGIRQIGNEKCSWDVSAEIMIRGYS